MVARILPLKYENVMYSRLILRQRQLPYRLALVFLYFSSTTWKM